MGLEIEIDRERCMGSGNCGFFAPATFDVGDDMKAFLLGSAASAGGDGGDAVDDVVLAADGCPTQAITVSRDGDRLFPA